MAQLFWYSLTNLETVEDSFVLFWVYLNTTLDEIEGYDCGMSNTAAEQPTESAITVVRH